MEEKAREFRERGSSIYAYLVELGSPDLIAHGGGLALNGPRPAEAIDRIRELGSPGVIDPLVCPRCGGRMKVIAVIEQDDVIFRILSHLGLVSAEDPSRAPPDAVAPPPAPKEVACLCRARQTGLRASL